MATYDRSYGTATMQSASDARIGRRLHLDWGAIFGGALIGWGALFVFALVGMIIGWAVLDPLAAAPTGNMVGAVIWDTASAIVAAGIGGYMVVTLAGDRRREASLAQGAVAWGMSMLFAALIALFASGASLAALRTPGALAARPHTPLAFTHGRGVLLAVFCTGGAALSFIGSLLGSLAAASKESGVPLAAEFKRRVTTNGHEHHATVQQTVRRDETTIIPPTH